MARKMKQHASGRQPGRKQASEQNHGAAGENQDGKFI